jgi:hypothetical protein
MFGWIAAALIAIAGFVGFTFARGFVKRRLRFVDAVYSPITPWVAGALAALVAWPVSWLPLVSTTTTAVFGIGAGLGTASGVKALKRGES